MKVTLSSLNYFPEHLSIHVKIIQMSHKQSDWYQEEYFKIALKKRLYTQLVKICRKSVVQNKDIRKEPIVGRR